MAGPVGRVLGGRYRLTRLVGAGGSASVYVAEDVKLGRQVAVKVLHPALAADPAFLRRFEAEARVAASLRHPNVMAVHDWGENDDPTGPAPYLVMELLDGGSLRELLDHGHRCTLAQVVLLGIQAARGLEHAHRRGLVHRDVKPANLLFDGDGRLVVADFGLARAIAEASVTEPVGTVLGTARYTSPEQAGGRRLDGRSDVYSLALVLVEAVTGRVPFSADTTMATLMARVDADLVAPVEMGALGPVIEHAARLDPADRMDAAQLVRELDAVAGRFGAAQPLPIGRAPEPEPASAGPDRVDDITVVAEAAPGRPSPAVYDAEAADETDAIEADATDGGARDGEPVHGHARADGHEDDTAALPVPALVAAGEARPVAVEAAPGHRRRRLWAVLAAVLVVLVAAGVAGAVTRPWRASHRIPDLTGKDQSAALALLHPLHLGLRVRGGAASEDRPIGEIVGQSPASTGSLREGSDVEVTLSSGPAPRRVVAVVGQDQVQAVQALAALALRADPIVQQYDEKTPAGKVLSQDPAPGAEVARGSSVRLSVSQGPAPRPVPTDLTGKSCDAASAKIQAVGLTAACTQVFDDRLPVGQVVSTSPAAGAPAPVGSTVAVRVSKGPELIAVPTSVKGASAAAAQQIITGAGLALGPTYGPVGGSVFRTNPDVGTKVKRGTSIAIYTQ